ncbi:MAG: hypothetical protein LC753_09080 [Acidobacteria bacterium]|nr:hypothetical protein [Acidobacteriota bacterium]
MTRRRVLLLAAAVLISGIATVTVGRDVGAGEQTLPARLSNQDFWKLIAELSEPAGFFQSDNLLSNEIQLQHVIPEPYIAALRPKIAFIVDVRRGNLQLHLMYKALFELSSDRAEFVSRLFCRPRPDGLGVKSSAQDIFNAYASVDSSEALFKDNLRQILSSLAPAGGHVLSPEDVAGIEFVYDAFCREGPAIQYWTTVGRSRIDAPTYAGLMSADDGKGESRSYLSSEATFTFVKSMHARNLIIPVVGNFAGPKAVRAVGAYLKERDAVVSAYYLSNVEQYLRRQGTWQSFCENVATLPLDETSTFIRSVRNPAYGFGVGLESMLGNMASEVKACATPSR